jgi:hypothetical protein
MCGATTTLVAHDSSIIRGVAAVFEANRSATHQQSASDGSHELDHLNFAGGPHATQDLRMCVRPPSIQKLRRAMRVGRQAR